MPEALRYLEKLIEIKHDFNIPRAIDNVERHEEVTTKEYSNAFQWLINALNLSRYTGSSLTQPP